jgi:hypothetical protein
LGLTTWAALRAGSAAKAAQEVKNRMFSLDTLTEISAALATLDEIKRHQRQRAWEVVLDRYAVVRKHLVRVEQMNPRFTDAQQAEFAKTIKQFRIIEAKVERARANPNDPIDPAKLNGIIADQSDVLERIMIAIKQTRV